MFKFLTISALATLTTGTFVPDAVNLSQKEAATPINLDNVTNGEGVQGNLFEVAGNK